MACGFSACHENRFSIFDDAPEDSLDIHIGEYTVSRSSINESMDKFLSDYGGHTLVEKYIASHYSNTHHLLWFSPDDGLTDEADTLLSWANRMEECGINSDKYYSDQLKEKLEILRGISRAEEEEGSESSEGSKSLKGSKGLKGSDEAVDTAMMIVALDYGLTKTFVKVYSALHFGLVNPYKTLNNLDTDPHDSLSQSFRTLYDVPTRIVNHREVDRMMSLVDNDSVGIALDGAEPNNALYKRLKSMLPASHGSERKRILVNMERLRWQQEKRPDGMDRYVLVNIPSFQLTAFNEGKDVLEMKIVCGSGKTKTPLLNSDIMRMDLNPKWNMPMSIIKHEVALHAQDSAYFARNHYYIREKKTGLRINPKFVTAEALKTGAYKVAQEGGEGNSLGRLIFRFKNNFSIFLHDTSSKGTFSRNDRRASHGCIRVEKPIELAEFLLDGKEDKNVLDTLRLGEKSHSYDVKPLVPLFIIYMTLWQTPDGKLLKYDDIYGYDEVIFEELKEYLR